MTPPSIPADISNALVDPGGGKVTLVIGAGCSKESPTSLPLSGECSVEAHRRLIEDLVLEQGDCSNPSDLSEVAEVVFAKTGSQDDLVKRLPRAEFKNAKANSGYLVAAALLREQAIQDVLNLNFDHAAMHALADLNVRSHVSVIAGPEDHDQMGTCNVVYLHRDANAPPDKWVLRKSELDKAWEDAWEQYVAARILAVPIVIFLGLGSPAAVLLDTCLKIQGAITGQKVFLVDPRDLADSPFGTALGIQAAEHVQEGWSAFMEAVGARVAIEHVAKLRLAITTLSDREGIPPEDCEGLLAELLRVGLVALGTARSAWIADEPGYSPANASDPELVADLLLGLATLQRLTGTEALVEQTGNVTLFKETSPATVVVPITGRGTKGLATIEAAAANRVAMVRPYETCVVLATGLTASIPEVSLPADIAAPPPANDILNPRKGAVYVTGSMLRSDPASVIQAIA